MTFIYHIIPDKNWESARKLGEYRAASLETEGFIHCSTQAQVAAVANAFYPGQRDLLLLTIDSARLTAPLQWDPPAHPAPKSAPASLHGKFPHIYGALNLDAVVKVRKLEPNNKGAFSFPAD
jgi:uncharacterized protein (DUF952 family)